MKKISKLLALCAGLAATTLVFAETEVKQQKEDKVDKVIVSYSAADAATENGRRQLERKIRRAAISLCGPQDLRGAGSMGQLRVNRACVNEAVAKAIRDISTIS